MPSTLACVSVAGGAGGVSSSSSAPARRTSSSPTSDNAVTASATDLPHPMRRMSVLLSGARRTQDASRGARDLHADLPDNQARCRTSGHERALRARPRAAFRPAAQLRDRRSFASPSLSGAARRSLRGEMRLSAASSCPLGATRLSAAPGELQPAASAGNASATAAWTMRPARTLSARSSGRLSATAPSTPRSASSSA